MIDGEASQEVKNPDRRITELESQVQLLLTTIANFSGGAVESLRAKSERIAELEAEVESLKQELKQALKSKADSTPD